MKTFKERFWSKVNKEGRLQPDGSRCWEWTGSKTDGYGRLSINGKLVLAHRAAWEIEHGPLSPSDIMMHDVCDNRQCVNIAHLKIGTHKLNNDSKESKGRANHPKGGAHGRSSITEDDAKAILVIWSTGLYKKAEIARMFGMYKERCGDLINGKTWKHLHEAIESDGDSKLDEISILGPPDGCAPGEPPSASSAV